MKKIKKTDFIKFEKFFENYEDFKNSKWEIENYNLWVKDFKEIIKDYQFMKNRKLALKDKTDRYFQDNLKEFERSLRIYKKTLKRYILTKLYY